MCGLQGLQGVAFFFFNPQKQLLLTLIISITPEFWYNIRLAQSEVKVQTFFHPPQPQELCGEDKEPSLGHIVFLIINIYALGRNPKPAFV